MVDFFSRPDTKWLINNKGCAPSEAFSILERGGNPSTKCGGRLTGITSLSQLRSSFPAFESAYQETLQILEAEQSAPAPAPAPAPEPTPEPTPTIEEPLPSPIEESPPPIVEAPPPIEMTGPEPIIDSSPAQTITAKKKKSRLDKLKERTAQRRGKTIEARFGFEGIVKQPTTFLVGEAGPERVKIKPIKKAKNIFDFDFGSPRKSSKRRKSNNFMFDFDFGKGVF